MNKIEVKIKKQFPDFLLDVSFACEEMRLGILGASGSGKSMTLKCIAGIITPDEGRIVIRGRVFFDSKLGINLKPQERNVGYMFQNYALFPNMCVAENIGASLNGKKADKKKIIQNMMKRFQLEGLEKRVPAELSGGQQQRVALARMMVCEPDILMLDEPFSALDIFLKDQMQQEMMDLLKEYKGSVIMVSHNRDEIYQFSSSLMVIKSGREICLGDTKGLFENPQYKDVAILTGCKNIEEIEKIAEHKCKVKKWNVELETFEKISDNHKYIGIRAHHFMVSKKEKNSIHGQIRQIVEQPFELKYSIGVGEGELLRMVSKRESSILPNQDEKIELSVNPSKIMLLRE